MVNRGYILCTVARNEETFFPKLASNVLLQSQSPCLWVLLDDQSIDHTKDRMEALALEHSWIRYYRYERPRSREFGVHLSRLKAHVTKLAAQIASAESLSYEFIGILDADIQIPPGFYAEMIDQMLKDPNIGLASAKIQEFAGNGNLYLKKSREDLPGCATLLCRRRCFDDIGGIDPEVYPEDAIMVAKAKLKNWDTKRFADITAIQVRKTHRGLSPWTGNIFFGEKVYFLRYPLIYVIVKAAHISFSDRFDLGFVFLWGYLKKLFSAGKRLEDPELVEYFRVTRSKENIRLFLRRFRYDK